MKGAFYGLRPASVGLIAAAGVLVARLALTDQALFQESGELLKLFRWRSILLALLLYAAMKKWKLHPAAFLALSAAVGILFRFAAG